MARRQNAMYGIYHALDEAGYFDGNGSNEKFLGNPANASHKDYKGPREYPKMFYHPQGQMRVVVPAEVIETPMGPKMVNEHKELICAIAANAAEGERFLAAGWHKTPSAANAAAGRASAPATAGERMKEMEEEIRRLTAVLNSQRAEVLADTRKAEGPAEPLTAASALAAAPTAEELA